MYDSSNLIKKFLKDHVSLTADQQKDMRTRRDVNVGRIKDGLEDAGHPAFVDTIDQGGHAMHTMTQPPQGDEDLLYDIDTGIVFEDDDSKTPATMRSRVCNALVKKGKNFKTAPKAKRKCVRVAYEEGYQCDFPVFKRAGEAGSYNYKIAIGDEWIASDPRAVNDEFDKDVKNKSPETDSDYQLRRIVRVGKYFAKLGAYKKRASFPSGLLVTRLFVDHYVARADRDDESFYETINALSKSLSEYTVVRANGSIITGAKDKDRLLRLKDFCGEAVENLRPLVDDEEGADDETARKCWKKVFRHDFFDSDAAKACNASASLETKSSTVTSVPLSAAERLARAERAAQRVVSPTKPWRK